MSTPRNSRRGWLRRALPWVLLLALSAGVLTAAPAARTVVFFGDSLTEGYGLADPDTESFPARIRARIEAEHLPWRVVNAGLSGETSAGGLRRIDWVLRQPLDLLVLELGANDGLRGTSPESTRANLQGIIDRVRRAHPGAKGINNTASSMVRGTARVARRPRATMSKIGLGFMVRSWGLFRF